MQLQFQLKYRNNSVGTNTVDADEYFSKFQSKVHWETNATVYPDFVLDTFQRHLHD